MIKKVCHSLKEVETKNILKLVDKSMYQVKMMEQILFEDSKKVMVDLYTDSQSFLDFVASSNK